MNRCSCGTGIFFYFKILYFVVSNPWKFKFLEWLYLQSKHAQSCIALIRFRQIHKFDVFSKKLAIKKIRLRTGVHQMAQWFLRSKWQNIGWIKVISKESLTKPLEHVWQHISAFLWFFLRWATFLVTSFMLMSWNKKNTETVVQGLLTDS